MTDYSPIACGLYSEYELAIMHGTRLRVQWQDASGRPYSESVVPVDLRTREGAEYLCVRLPGGEVQEIRLDRIREVVPLKD